MKKITTLLLLSLLVFSLMHDLKATHWGGGSLQYEYLNSCTLRVHLKFYRYCDAIDGISGATGFIASASGCALPVPLGNWSPQLATEVTPVCPGTLTDCGTGTMAGLEELYWARDYNMCVAGNCNFRFNWESCCRNNSMVNIVQAQGYHVGSFVINNSQVVQNHAPEYTRKPFLQGCSGRDHVISQGAYDPDGDSLSFYLGRCFQAYNVPVAYNNGYTGANPLGSSWNVSIDSSTGTLSVLANPGNSISAAVCIYVDEYRNGVLINNYARDFWLNMLSCSVDEKPSFGAISNISGGSLVSPNEIHMCGNGQLCFDLPASDPDTNDVLEVSWDQHLSGATFSDATNSQVQNVISGINPIARFCWTPPGNGRYQFLATVIDDECPYYALEDKMVTIVVGGNGGGSGLSNATASLVGCNSVSFSGNVCGANGPIAYSWSGQGGLTSSQQTFSHFYTSAGTYAWQVIISDGLSLNDTIQDSVVIAPTNVSTLISPGGGGGSLTICPTQTINLSAPAGYVSYLWSNGSTASNIQVNTAGVYSVTVTDSGACTYYDFVAISAQTGTPAASVISSLVSNSLKMCNPLSNYLNLSATGFATYQWSNGDTTANITITSAGTYSVIATNLNGCQFTDSVVILEDTNADLSGTIQTYNGFPLANQKVFLVVFDTLNNALWPADTAITDANGNYQFCNLISGITYFVKAAPDSATYPMDMPTYYDTTMFWNHAVPLSGANAPYVVNFHTLLGFNPGGPGFISGLISQGANKTAGVGDPTPNVRLVLRNANTGYFVDEVFSDSNGYVSFANLAYGTYLIYPDHPFVATKTDSVPSITIDANNPSFTGLKFLLHSTYLELDFSAASISMEKEATFEVYPNPFGESTLLDFSWKPNVKMEYYIFDLSGRVIGNDDFTLDQTGSAKLSLGKEMGSGVYFVELVGEGRRFVKKVVKL